MYDNKNPWQPRAWEEQNEKNKCEACKEHFDYPRRLKHHLETKKHKFQQNLLESTSIPVKCKHTDGIDISDNEEDEMQQVRPLKS